MKTTAALCVTEKYWRHSNEPGDVESTNILSCNHTGMKQVTVTDINIYTNNYKAMQGGKVAEQYMQYAARPFKWVAPQT